MGLEKVHALGAKTMDPFLMVEVSCRRGMTLPSWVNRASRLCEMKDRWAKVEKRALLASRKESNMEVADQEEAVASLGASDPHAKDLEWSGLGNIVGRQSGMADAPGRYQREEDWYVTVEHQGNGSTWECKACVHPGRIIMQDKTS